MKGGNCPFVVEVIHLGLGKKWQGSGVGHAGGDFFEFSKLFVGKQREGKFESGVLVLPIAFEVFLVIENGGLR